MKNFIKILLLSSATLACALPALRSEDTNPAGGAPETGREEFGGRFRKRGEHIAKELGLTDDQKAQMKALGEEQKAAADAVRADASLTDDLKKQKVKQIRQDFKAKRESLLTPDQKKKADEMRANFEEHRAGDRQGRGAGGPPGERMSKELGLSAEQQTQMQAIGQEQRVAADAVRADASLTPEQKKEKMTQLWQEFKAKRQALLTPEQRTKAESMKEQFRGHHRHEDGEMPSI